MRWSITQSQLLDALPSLLPLAAEWAQRMEDRGQTEGTPLLGVSLADAAAMGVAEPANVRVIIVGQIPKPEDPQLRAAAEAVNFLAPQTAGLALGYTIFLRKDVCKFRRLVAHECVHVGQYERLGGIEPFLTQYLTEVVTLGYKNSPLEMEAEKRAEEVPHVILS